MSLRSSRQADTSRGSRLEGLAGATDVSCTDIAKRWLPPQKDLPPDQLAVRRWR